MIDVWYKLPRPTWWQDISWLSHLSTIQKCPPYVTGFASCHVDMCCIIVVHIWTLVYLCPFLVSLFMFILVVGLSLSVAAALRYNTNHGWVVANFIYNLRDSPVKQYNTYSKHMTFNEIKTPFFYNTKCYSHITAFTPTDSSHYHSLIHVTFCHSHWYHTCI